MIHHPPKPRLALTLGVTGHRFIARAARRPKTEADAPRPSTSRRSARRSKRCSSPRRRASRDRRRGEGELQRSPAGRDADLVARRRSGPHRRPRRARRRLRARRRAALPGADLRRDFRRRRFARANSTLCGVGARATLILPLAGDCAAPIDGATAATFESAGLTMLAQSDILVAVWDGKPADGRGGTGQIVEEAARRGAPIVVVDPEDGATRLLWSDEPADEATARRALDIAPRSLEPALAELIARIVGPPLAAEERAGLKQYFCLSRRRRRAAAARVSSSTVATWRRRARNGRASAPRSANRPANRAAARRYVAGAAGGRRRRRAPRRPPIAGCSCSAPRRRCWRARSSPARRVSVNCM